MDFYVLKDGMSHDPCEQPLEAVLLAGAQATTSTPEPHGVKTATMKFPLPSLLN